MVMLHLICLVFLSLHVDKMMNWGINRMHLPSCIALIWEGSNMGPLQASAGQAGTDCEGIILGNKQVSANFKTLQYVWLDCLYNSFLGEKKMIEEKRGRQSLQIEWKYIHTKNKPRNRERNPLRTMLVFNIEYDCLATTWLDMKRQCRGGSPLCVCTDSWVLSSSAQRRRCSCAEPLGFDWSVFWSALTSRFIKPPCAHSST